MKTLETDLLKIKSVIGEIIDDSESIYGYISEKLPVLENQAESAICESNRLLNRFKKTQSSDSLSFINLVNDLDNEMEDIYNELIDQQDLKDLMDQITSENSDKLNINTLLNVIDDLEKVFENLEQLSTNAIIFSSKLEHGDAFRVISREINKISQKVKKDYNVFENNLIDLKNWNKDFANNLENLIEIENDIFKQYNNSLTTSIEDIIESLKGICILIKDFISQVEKSLEPIEKIIVELQDQDLIRQNMENLTEIINTLIDSVEKYNNQDLETNEALDTLQFIIDISDLSKNLMNNVDEQFTASIDNIIKQALNMDEILRIINDDGKTLWDYMVGGIKEDTKVTSSIDKKNKQVIKEITLFEKKMNEIIENYSDLDTCDEILEKHLSELALNFENINKMANRFNRIKLLAKIEFARLNRNDNAHIKKIEKVIDLFIDFTQENEDIFYDIENTLMIDINDFSVFRKKITKDLDIAKYTIQNSKEELRNIKGSVKNTINQLTDITSSLYEDVHIIINEFESFGDMSNQIYEINNVLDNLIVKASKRKENLLERHNIDKWESTNDYYESIEEKFTSYIERKTASDTLDTKDLDTGTSGGELTLF